MTQKVAQAATGRAAWLQALQGLADLTRSEHAQLIGLGAAHSIPFNWVTDFPARALREFVDVVGTHPHVNPRIAAAADASLLEVVREQRIESHYGALQNDAYLELSHRYDIPYGCQAAVVRQPDLEVGLALLRTRANGPTSNRQAALFAAVAGHVRAAVMMQIALESQGDLLIVGALEMMSAAAFLCDARGSVRGATPEALGIVSAGASLQLTGGRLRATISDDDRRLQIAVGDVASADLRQPLTPARRTIVLRGDGLEPMVLDVMPLAGSSWSFDYVPKVLVVVRRSRVPGELELPLICQAFAMTPVEAGIARQLVCGMSREEIAAGRGVSLETIRSQIKAIFRKTGVNRIVDLAARLQALQ